MCQVDIQVLPPYNAFVMFSGADVNVGSKERELHRLLEVLRIKAEIHVLVFYLLFLPIFVFHEIHVLVFFLPLWCYLLNISFF